MLQLIGENSQPKLESDVIFKKSLSILLKKSGFEVSVLVSKSLLSKKVSNSISKKSFDIGVENIWSLKKSRCQSRVKFLVLSLSATRTRSRYVKNLTISKRWFFSQPKPPLFSTKMRKSQQAIRAAAP